MLHKMENVPSHVAAFKATGEVSKTDYENVLIPELQRVDKEHGHIHLLMVLDTPSSNFTLQAWMQDAVQVLKHFRGWKKVALVTDEDGIRKFTNVASVFVPGQSKGFTHAQLEEAKQWVSAEE